MSSMCRLLVMYEISWTPGVQLAPVPTLFETAILISLKTHSAKLMMSIDLERKAGDYSWTLLYQLLQHRAERKDVYQGHIT